MLQIRIYIYIYKILCMAGKETEDVRVHLY